MEIILLLLKPTFMFGPLLLPLLGMGMSAIGQGININQQNTANQQSLDFQREMYSRQRKDALTDMAFQNEYNSPAAQMERLKKAGLNPNLVYGNGNAVQTGAPVRASSPGSYAPKAPQVETGGIINSMMSFYDASMKTAQTDNIKAATKVAIEEAVNKAADTALKIADAKKRGVEIDLDSLRLQTEKLLQPTVVDQARANLGKTIADTEYTLQQKEITALTSAQNLVKGMEEIIQMRLQHAATSAEIAKYKQELELLKKDNLIKAIDVGIRQTGATLHDGAISRFVQAWLNDPGSAKAAANKFLNKISGDKGVNWMDAFSKFVP